MDQSFNMKQFPAAPDHSRTRSEFSQTSQGVSTYSNQNSPNPFATPNTSIYNGVTSAYARSESGAGKYFRSRRIQKDQHTKPPVFKKDPKEKWLTIMPVTGVLVGLAITGVLIYFKVGRTTTSQFCPILYDDFSQGINPAIWTMEQEVGGFGYVPLSRI